MWGGLSPRATCQRDRKGSKQHASHRRGAPPHAWLTSQTRVSLRRSHLFLSESLLVAPREGPDCHKLRCGRVDVVNVVVILVVTALR